MVKIDLDLEFVYELSHTSSSTNKFGEGFDYFDWLNRLEENIRNSKNDYHIDHGWNVYHDCYETVLWKVKGITLEIPNGKNRFITTILKRTDYVIENKGEVKNTC